MISQGRSPILEKLLSNGNHPDVTTTTSFDRNPEELNKQFSRDIPTSNSNLITNETFACQAISAQNQVASYFVDVNKDNLGQASDIWTQSDISPNGLPYSDHVLWYTEHAQLLSAPVSSIPPEANIAGIPDFLFTVHEQNPAFVMMPQQVLTDIQTIANNNSLTETNIGRENPSNMAEQQSYSPTSNRLRHFSLPSSNFPCGQDSSLPDLYSELTNNLFYQPVPYPSPIEMNNAISSACLDYNSFLTRNTQYFNEQLNQFPDNIPNQTLLNFCPLNFVAPSFFNQYLLETHVNTQMCNEIRHTNNTENSNLHQLANTCASKEPILNSYTNPRNDQEISECSVYPDISRTKPLSHQPFSSVKEPCELTYSIRERGYESCSPKFYEKLKLDQTIIEQTPLCLVKEPSLTEQVKAQVDEFVSSPKKQPGLKKCSCPVCGRNLARSTTLKIHLRQHSGDRPFKCPLCPKSFAQKSLLTSHRRTHSGERPYSCTLCQKTFAHSSALKTHTRTHTGERPHLCPILNCGMAFSDSSTLSKHARVHSGERPYLCNICGRRFTQSGNMNKHRRTAHNVRNEMTMMKIRENTKILAELLGDDEKTTSAD